MDKKEEPVNVYDFSFSYVEKVTGKMVAISEEAAIEGLKRDYDSLGELMDITVTEKERFDNIDEFLRVEKRRRIEEIAEKLGMSPDEVEEEVTQRELEERKVLN